MQNNLSLIILLYFICDKFINVHSTELSTSERNVGLKLFPSENRTFMGSRKCLDLCHLKYFRYFPCSLENGKYVDNPTVVCQESYCEAETVEHLYETSTGNGSSIWKTHINRIEKTKVGEEATFRDLCLDSEGFPKKMLCIGRSMWQSLDNLTCYQGTELNIKVNYLINQITTGESSQIMELRKELSKWRGKLSIVDIFNIGNMFAFLMDQPQKDVNVGLELIGICMEVMASSSKVLKLSAKLNATNILLSKFEEYMDTLATKTVPSESCSWNQTILTDNNVTASEVESAVFNQNGVYSLISGKLSVFFVNPQCNNITGIAIYRRSSPELHESRNGFWYRFLQYNETLEQLRQESHLEIATYIPQELWIQLAEKGANYVVFKVYSHDNLFVEATDHRNRRPRSKVLSISIPGFEALSLPQVLPFLLRNENHQQPDAMAINTGSGCGYWNYTTWLSDGVVTCNERDIVNDPLIVCYALHLTQFTFLLGGSNSPSISNLPSDNLHNKILDYITIIGCLLSLTGLLAIFVMALTFTKFRETASTKVLLHLCAALTLQTLLFIIVNCDRLIPALRHINVCLLFGALMHYSVLVEFIWMLIIAILQYQRYVIVLGVKRPPSYILVSSLLAWLLPFLAILSIVLVSPSLYKPYENRSHINICYPSGDFLLLTVVLPIVVITLANIWMVGCIISSIHKASNLYGKRQCMIQELKLFVLLFFLLGLTWIFGLCNYIHFGIIFSYLFCVTATLQGFVLFIYFCLINRTNRILLLSLFVNSKNYQTESRTNSVEIFIKRRSVL